MRQAPRADTLFQTAQLNISEGSPLKLLTHHNRSFVFMEYAGYLRRDSDIGGFLFWLFQVNRFPVRDTEIQHAMVCAFMMSREYQERFGSIVMHSNADCGP